MSDKIKILEAKIKATEDALEQGRIFLGMSDPSMLLDAISFKRKRSCSSRKNRSCSCQVSRSYS